MDLAVKMYGDQLDIDVTNGEARLVTGQEAIAQDIKMSLEMWLGESVYDEEAGLPYLQAIFGVRRFVEGVGFFWQREIKSRPGVREVMSLDFDLDNVERRLTCTGRVRTIEGDVDFGALVNGGA